MDQQTKHLRLTNYKNDGVALIKILNEWDFIGVFSIDSDWPKNEYSCLLDPILYSLYNNATPEELSAIIQKDVSEHFEVDLKKSSIDTVVKKIMTWWNNNRQEMTLPEKIENESIHKIISLAKDICKDKELSELDIARKCREINQLLPRDTENKDLTLFTLIDSDCDDKPLDEEVRKRWNQEELQKLDGELKEYIQFYKKNIDEACEKLIEIYSHSSLSIL